MINDNSPATPETKTLPFGNRLQTARESLQLDRKEAASRLRLNEKVIIMMEKDRYPADLPVTFIRGYIRAYSKLLSIPDYEIKAALEHIKPKQTTSFSPLTTLTPLPINSGNSFMQFFTYLIVLTLISLVSLWWYTTTTSPAAFIESQLTTMPSVTPETPQPPPEVALAAPSAPPTIAPEEQIENTVDTTKKITNHTKPAMQTAQSKNPRAHLAPVEEGVAAGEIENAEFNED